MGKYWDKALQIDVVGLREDGWTDIGECKWGTVRSARKLAEEIRSKAAKFPNDRGASLGSLAFTRRKPRVSAEAVRWYDLEALYDLS